MAANNSEKCAYNWGSNQNKHHPNVFYLFFLAKKSFTNKVEASVIN